MPMQSSRDRFTPVDGMRGLAAIMVVFGHAYQATGSPYPNTLLPLVLFGNSGVDLFFVISGFCLFYPLTKPGSAPNWPLFYRRRARRLLPPYYAALAAVVGLPLLIEPPMRALGVPVGPMGVTPWHQIWTHALFVQTLFPDTFYALNGPLWSLSIEWQFYLAFPLAVLLLRALRWRGVALIGIATVAYRIGINASALGAQRWPVDVADLFLSRWVEFALGMLVALYVRRRGDRPPAVGRELSDLAGLIGIYFLGSYLLYGPLGQYPYPDKDLLNSVFWAPVLAMACRRGSLIGRLFSWPPIVWLGIISYSLYLTHLPLLFSLGPIVNGAGFGQPATLLVMCATGTPLCLGCAALFFHVFERPFLNHPRPLSAPRARSAQGEVGGMA